MHVVDRAMKLGERTPSAYEPSLLGVATYIRPAERSERPFRTMVHTPELWSLQTVGLLSE